MGWSYLVNGERTIMLKDADIVAVVALMDREVQSAPTRYAAVAETVAHWQEYLPGTGPGTILLPMHSVCESEDTRVAFERLVSDVAAALDSFGVHVPAAVLASHGTVPDILWRDFPTRSLRDALAAFRAITAPK